MQTFLEKGKLRHPTGVRVRAKVTPGWGRGKIKTLTSEDLPLLSDVPGIQGGTLLGLHRGALVEMLGEVWLVQTRDIDYLPLGDVVLLHVAFDHFGSPPRILTRHISKRLGCWLKTSGEIYSLSVLPKLCEKLWSSLMSPPVQTTSLGEMWGQNRT